MPIGKNAIKRVTNNGYSNVNTSAPDMENSVVAEEKKETPKKKSTKPQPSKAPKKESTSKKAPTPKKSMETEPELAPVKTAEKVIASAKREGDGYVNIGGNLPDHLL